MLRAPALFSLLLLLTSCRGGERSLSTYQGAPVIIITIDTLRADRLPMYGYKGSETPHLDAFRRDAILYRNAYSHVPLTLPSHISLLTGMLPHEHKVRNNIGYVLDPKIPTLPRLLKARGYDTGAAISAFVLRGSTGLRTSFDFYEDTISSRGNLAVGQVQRSGRKTAQLAESWIGPRAARPFFFMLHLFEPHAPYEPEEPFRSRLRDPYDGEIATTDAIVGSFIAALKRMDVYDRAIIVVLSDHGEGLNDHGEPEHGIFVYREAIHVPLLLKLPEGDRAGETADEPVGIVDVLPTITALTGATAPARVSGRSLLGPRDAARRIYAESIYPRIHLGWSELRSLVDSRFQFIAAPKPELYDIVSDPGQRTNILEQERRTYSAMREDLTRYESNVEMPGTVDPEEAKKLAALGYLSSTSPAGSGPLPDPKDRIGEIGAMIRASNLLRERRFDEAALAFHRIVEANPRLSDGWNQLGTALEAAGRYEEASDVYKQVIDLTPELASEFGLRRASVLLKLEQYDEAEKHARLAERTNASAMHLVLSSVALAKKDFARAESEARAAAVDPNDRNAAELLIARTLSQQGKAQEAYALVQQVGARLSQEGGGAMERFDYVRGDALARMERYEEAMAAFRQEIANFPDYRQTYANLYLIYVVLNRRAEANAVLEEMVRAGPGKQTMLFAARTVGALGDDNGEREWKRRAAAAR